MRIVALKMLDLDVRGWRIIVNVVNVQVNNIVQFVQILTKVIVW